MPNWTWNLVFVTGTEADLRAFLAAIRSESGDKPLDFNRIVPMPELLRHTGCGGCIIDGQKVASWYIIDRAEFTDQDRVRLFTPDEEAELKRIGFDSWYDWSVFNWGTKWNACETEIDGSSIQQGSLDLRFDTAWDAPLPVLQAMIQMFPALSFECWRRDEDDDPRQPYRLALSSAEAA